MYQRIDTMVVVCIVDFGKLYDVVLHNRPNYGVLRYGHKRSTELKDLNRRLEALAAAGMELFEVRV